MTNPEASAMLRIARRDLKAAQVLQDPSIDEAIWGFQIQQVIHNLTALLERISQSGKDVEDLRCLEAFTVFAVQFRYDADPEPMGLDRSHWLRRAEHRVAHVAAILGSEA